MPERATGERNPRKARTPTLHQARNSHPDVIAEHRAANAPQTCACGKPALYRLRGRFWCKGCKGT